ncbi:MAG: SDR family NAD(P)-dependent oxidoreductase [Solirubrobacterales bacterium]
MSKKDQTNGALRFQGRAGVVTGGGSGLGREVCLRIAREGGGVVIFDRDSAAAEAVQREAEGLPGAALAFVGDVTREEDLLAAFDLCQKSFGVFDLLHNNAGIQGSARFHETANEVWEAVLDVNLKAVFWGCKHAVLAMRGSGGGSIVNTASMLALVGDPYLPAYTAAKTGVLGLTRAIAVDYAADGIRANCVCPGDMDTPMNQEYFASLPDPEGERAVVEGHYPVGRFAAPAEVAAAVLFLLSAESSFITGTHLTVDGGITAKPY